MIRMLHHHGYRVGVQIGRAVGISEWLYERAERLSGCPGGDECELRHRLEHAAYRGRKGLPLIDREVDE